MIDSRRDVLERRRPATPAAKSETAVLEVPDRPAAVRKVHHQQILQPEVVARPPESSVNEDRHGPRAGARGRRQLPELVPAPAVRIPSSRDRPSIVSSAAGAAPSSGGSARSAAGMPAAAGTGSRGRRRGKRGAWRSAGPSPDTLVGHGKLPVMSSTAHEHRQPEPARRTSRRIASAQPSGGPRAGHARPLAERRARRSGKR
jgi:hypothetical protein